MVFEFALRSAGDRQALTQKSHGPAHWSGVFYINLCQTTVCVNLLGLGCTGVIWAFMLIPMAQKITKGYFYS
jgi:hypothetical protein